MCVCGLWVYKCACACVCVLLTGLSVWLMPMRKTSSEKKSAATRFLWMSWRLERRRRNRASRMKVRSSATRDAVTEVYVTIFRGSTSPC